MTQEEKAKAYDEAIERAKEVYDAYRFSMDMSNFNPTDIEYIFPQLAESEDERIRKEIIEFLQNTLIKRGIKDGKDKAVKWIAYLENLKPSFRQIHDSAIWDNGLRTGIELDLNRLEQQKEEAGYEEIPVESTPEYKLGFKAGKESEKQKEQQPIEMEVYEVGKGTTICGQDYKCKKDYKVGNCWYIKDVIYHCSRDGYLNDQNGVSWCCTPKWFNEYIYTNSELADEEKNDFVSGQFLQCKLSFDGFKEGEHYWLEYIGDDMYVGRSDNILNQKFHITPRQLYTLFSEQLEENEKEQNLNFDTHWENGSLVYEQKEQKPAERFEEAREKYQVAWSEEEKDKLKSIERLIVNANAHGNYLIGDKEATELQHFIRSIVKPTTNLAEWSEEDEKKMIFLERLIEYNVPDGQYGWADGRKGGFVTKSEAISMLKSLRTVSKESLQPHWKPCEEQMRCLDMVLCDEAMDDNVHRVLVQLREQLKKLMSL